MSLSENETVKPNIRSFRFHRGCGRRLSPDASQSVFSSEWKVSSKSSVSGWGREGWSTGFLREREIERVKLVDVKSYGSVVNISRVDAPARPLQLDPSSSVRLSLNAGGG